MDCIKINEKLSAYIENQLDPEEQKNVNHHLKTCQNCRTALRDLRKTIEYARSIEETEPPAWLAQKIMAKVREESEKKGILKKLFYPFHIKIPLEVFATITIAVIAVFVFKAMQPVMKQTEIPLKDTAAPREELPGVVKEQGPDSRGMSSQAMRPGKNESIGEKEVVPAAKAGMNKSVVRDSLSSEMESKKEMRAFTPETAGMLKQVRQVIPLILYAKDIDTARREVENLVRRLGGRILENKQGAGMHIYNVQIDAGRLEDLKNELNRIGKCDTKVTDYETTGLINARIELIEKKSK